MDQVLDKVKKPRNALGIGEVLCSMLCFSILQGWRAPGGATIAHLPNGSYYGFLVAMAVALFVFRLVYLIIVVLDFNKKIPYFDIFNLFFSAGLVLLLFLACILCVIKSTHYKTIQAGIVFGYFTLILLAIDVVVTYLQLRK